MPTTGIRRAIADENTPPSLSTKVKPFKNTSRKPRATLLATGNANQAITATQPASKAVAIQVQSPSSDGLDHDIVRTATQDMPPTPPASQSPPPLPRRSRRSNAGVPPTSSQTALVPPPHANVRSRSSSAQPSSSIPLRTTAPKRRSSTVPSASAPPRASTSHSSRAKPTAIPRPKSHSQSEAATKPKSRTRAPRRSSLAVLKRHPTPTETLDVPLGQIDDGSDTEDPLLLKASEELRGKGEGKSQVLRERSRSRSRSQSAAARTVPASSRAASIAESIEEHEDGESDNEDHPDRLLAQQIPEPLPLDSEADFHWRDDDLLPLGSGTVEEDLPELPSDDEAQDMGGFEHAYEPDAVIERFDLSALEDQPARELRDSSEDEDEQDPSHDDEGARFAQLQDQDSDSGNDYDDQASEECVVDTDTTPQRPRIPRLPADQTGEYEYVQPIQPMSSPERNMFEAARPSPFLTSPTIAESSRAATVSMKLESPERPLPPLPEPMQREVWTRGPGFFRSSPVASRSPSIGPMADGLADARETEDESEGESGSSDAEVEASLVMRSPPDLARLQQTYADTAMKSPSPRRPSSLHDIPMSTPSPSHNGSKSPSGSLRSIRKLLPFVPTFEDTAMASPSPARSSLGAIEAVPPSPSPARTSPTPAPIEVRQPSPPSSLERLRVGGIVEAGRATLQSLLMFGTNKTTVGAVDKGKAVEHVEQSSEAEVEPESSGVASDDSNAAEDAENEEPADTPARELSAPVASTSTALLPTSKPPTSSAVTATPVSQSGRENTTSASKSTAPRRSGHGVPRSTGPHVVEISSTDPRAAARAAAILKVYHDYIEQGIEVPDSLLDEAGIRRSAFKRRSQVRGEELIDTDDHDDRIRGLLRRAEEEVLANASVIVGGSGATPGRLLPRAAAVSVAPSPLPAGPVDLSQWTSADWRRLERALVNEGRESRQAGRQLVVEKVIMRFLDNIGVNPEACTGVWAWDTLATRVTALQKRRFQDSQRRASSGTPQTTDARRLPRVPSTLEAELERVAESDERAEPVMTAPSTRSASVDSTQVKEEDLSEEETSALASPEVIEGNVSASDDDDDDDDDGDPDHNAEDDTFFERAGPRAMPAVSQPPLALTSSRFAHLYDEPIEKPRLPSQTWVPSSSVDPEEEDDSGEYAQESTEVTPPPSHNAADEDEVNRSPAKKLFSYLGGLVRRSTPTSAVPVETSEDAAPPEMKQVSSERPVTINFASTEGQPYPSVTSTARRIRPLPGSISTPTSGLARELPRKRLSSGGRVASEIARLEEAETSREEDEAELLRSLGASSGAAKRRASSGDLRGLGVGGATSGRGLDLVSLSVPAKKPAVFVPSGTRALDRPIGEKLSRRW